LWIGGGTPVAALIVLNPCVQFKAVESNPLASNAELGEARPDLAVEAVTVHAEVARGVAEAE
jgi:hypothetical protein